MQLKKQMYAGLFALMLVAAIVTIPHALADKSEKSRDTERKSNISDHKSRDSNHDEKARLQKPIRQVFVAIGVGVGAAVDNDGNLHRSHYQIDLANVVNTNSTSTNSTTSDMNYQVKKGQIFILEKGTRGTYKIIPETWKIDITDGKTTFSATGQVKGGNNTYDVSLIGTKIRDVKNGSLYRVDGKINGNSTEYELHYISTFSKKNHSGETISDASD